MIKQVTQKTFELKIEWGDWEVVSQNKNVYVINVYKANGEMSTEEIEVSED